MATAEDTHGEAIEKLKQIQDELEKINEKELLEIKQKRNEMSKLLYRKRNNVIEFIHDFWKTAFLGHTYLRNLLSEEDQEVFKYFSSLEVENHEDVKSGYSITFNFNPNCYFSDTKIAKTFTFNEEGTTKITATPIQWRRGKARKFPKDKRRKGTSCLLPIKVSLAGLDRDTEQKLDRDGAIVAMIKDYLWPNPLEYFKLTMMKLEDHEDEDVDEEDVGKDDDDDQEHDDN